MQLLKLKDWLVGLSVRQSHIYDIENLSLSVYYSTTQSTNENESLCFSGAFGNPPNW